jgi:glycosyltransferase involved in cell wall biosynthesis
LNEGKLRISVLVPELSKGGMTRAYLIAQVLQALQYESEIVGCLRREEQIYPAPPANIRVSAVPYGDFPILAAKLINRLNGDLVYAIKPMPTSFGVALVNRLSSRRPVILDIDDWEFPNCVGEHQRHRVAFEPWGRKITGVGSRSLRRLLHVHRLKNPDHWFYFRWMERQISTADAVTVNTRLLQKHTGGTYLPSGKDTSLFDPSKFDAEVCRKRYGLSQYRVLMFPGTARPHKGLEDLLVGVEKLGQPDLRLVLVGGRKIGDEFIDLLLQKWGRWIIRLPRYGVETMPEVVAAAHIIVVPQRDTLEARAQFPMKLTDGMAMAKPILSTRVGDIPNILGDTGYLVDPSSPEQLADRIEWIFHNLEEANLQGMKARKRCVKCYSLKALGCTLLGVIANVAESRRALN